MVELSFERVDTILEEETPRKVKLTKLLRAIYTRYMRLYEKYFSDIEALNNDVIDELKRYQEETNSLVKYYYMDIPQDVCTELKEFNEKYGSKLLGPNWHKFLFDTYDEFREENWDKSEEFVKAEFKKQVLDSFYDEIGSVFRQGFGTTSKTTVDIINGAGSLFFGKDDDE